MAHSARLRRRQRSPERNLPGAQVSPFALPAAAPTVANVANMSNDELLALASLIAAERVRRGI
jgi:hypothetical protein